ncbi:MAG: site-specific DNA-methyltransferase [Bacteroidales bacterium]|nr:site-specific DNA-methyltransferase [Bacteroidales bacterium]
MTESRKTAAPRNRTITIGETELTLLKDRLVTLDQLRDGGMYIDKTINANVMDVLPLLPDGFADLIIIDPPYNLSKDFNGNKFNAMTDSQYIEYIGQWLPQVVAKLKPTGSLYLCGDWKCTAALQQMLSQQMHIINRITWQREKGRGAMRNWKNSMEDIWFAVKDPKNYYFDVEAVKMKRKVVAPYRANGKPKDWEETENGNYRITYPSNFWDDISVPFWSMPENTEHPTQKPEKLIAKLILASSKKGDIVFDPFLGSGTTSVVAKKLGRKYCGVELNVEYCCLAEKRLATASLDRSIQGFFDGVFWERNTSQVQKSAKVNIPFVQNNQTAMFSV